MLGEECPRSTCYGIPLVRPPKTGQEKDPRKVRSYSVATPKADMCGQNTNTPILHRSALYVLRSTWREVWILWYPSLHRDPGRKRRPHLAHLWWGQMQHSKAKRKRMRIMIPWFV